jgi:hypothetical protein
LQQARRTLQERTLELHLARKRRQQRVGLLDQDWEIAVYFCEW